MSHHVILSTPLLAHAGISSLSVDAGARLFGRRYYASSTDAAHFSVYVVSVEQPFDAFTMPHEIVD